MLRSIYVCNSVNLSVLVLTVLPVWLPHVFPLFHLAEVRVVHCIRYGMHRQLECLVHIR